VAVIAATQSLDHLASVMGSRDFRSLLPNFGNHFFFRSTEGIKLVTTFTAEYPLKLLELRQQQGHLLIAFIGDAVPPETYMDWIETLQRSLYPIRTRPLKRKDRRLLDGHSLDETNERRE
jgi:hypothetical protein